MVNYWDYDSGTAGSAATTTDFWRDPNDTSASATVTATVGSGNWTTTRIPVVRKILVRCPKRWSERDHAAFVKMVNKETNTGWKVYMIIREDILITDPDIEVMGMESFLEIMQSNAGHNDRERIREFKGEML